MKYSQEKLQAAFASVQDKNHWKNPIPRQWINKDEKDLIAEAINHFTATEMEIHSESYGKLLISAKGYRNGPAGDF